MLGYSELKNVFEFILQTGLVTKIYQDVIIYNDGNEKYPAYRSGDEYVYIGVTDSAKMNCYLRQTGNAERVKTDYVGSNSKLYIVKVPYRFVFFNDYETRSFDDVYLKILQMSIFQYVDFVKLIIDRKQLINEETEIKDFPTAGLTFYCALDVIVTIKLLIDNCNIEINCDFVQNK